MDSKKQDLTMDSKNQDPANDELKDKELTGVTGGLTDIEKAARHAAGAAAAGVADADIRAHRGFGPLIGH